MQTVLDSGNSWFFDSLTHGIDDRLVISLVEGIKGPEVLPVEIAPGVIAGHFYPIQVLEESRCVEVSFNRALGFLVFNESFDAGDESLVTDDGVLRECSSGQAMKFLNTFTNIQNLSDQAVRHFVLWTEDRVIYVASDNAPDVQLSNETPNLAVQRSSNWSAS